ncbi:sulfatase-like hydrolase/transferase [Flavihumibacter sediminis]|nr:sulfatase-like hydrolase/transferase [Flavihumibacter sediminis]
MKQFINLQRERPSYYLLRISVIFLFVSGGLLSIRAFSFSPAASKPNIIIILVDDAGYADFGFMGSKDLQTPNIDKLAAGAIRFMDAHVSASVCSPSRAGLLTGKYQQRFGYECNEGEGYPGMDTSQTILPKLLQQQGYRTAAFGKWHLGFEPAQHPLQKGYQYYYGFLSGGRSYFYRPQKDDRLGSKNGLLENRNQVPFEGYLTDRLGDKAVEYIRENKDHPFFIYWAPNAVHTPMEASEEDMEKFANHPRQKLAAMTFSLDRAIGKMVEELKKHGLFENTLIFFLSDNGGAHDNLSNNFPLKGFKGNKYEAGHRVPFFISWPKQFDVGVQYHGLSSSLDIFPTALEAAGVSIQPTLGIDGISLIPFLTGEKNDNPHHELVWRKDGAAAIRFNQYKLIRINGAGERLYDLSEDPGESNDLQQIKPEIFSLLKQKLNNWEKDKMKPAWTEGAVWDTITLMIHDDLMHNQKVRVRNPAELNEYRSID